MAGETTVDVGQLSEIGWDHAAQERVATAFRHLLSVIGEEEGKTARTEAPKLTISLTGTYTQKTGPGVGVGLSISF